MHTHTVITLFHLSISSLERAAQLRSQLQSQNLLALPDPLLHCLPVSHPLREPNTAPYSRSTLWPANHATVFWLAFQRHKHTHSHC